ncbi:hypothetical protein P691DRAFT_758549 [Macrolepiota fuliginosa MF-IS2]|uniref:Uncharacterized protein n=1 Tax=Macrolepiota fuliginosa MF-IS2 TaxID=1400762 RepID=A0A9P5XER8_9AGAR|nr:hypothetical protein P691DRAFT_758549 [Macrolepiota fuliginosa MF-IS2]
MACRIPWNPSFLREPHHHYQDATMKYGSCTFFTYDDPPAPQEPPQHHTPLPPPRSRAGSSFNHRPSSSGSNNSTSTQSTSPAQSPILRPHAHKMRTKCMNDSLPSAQKPERSAGALLQPAITSNEGTIGTNHLVTKDKSGTTISISLPHIDNHASFNTSFKDAILAQIAALHVGASGGEWAPTQSDVEGKSFGEGKIPSNTTTMEWTGSPACSDTLTGSAGPQAKFSMDRRRSEVEADGRSMISSLLDAYCRSDMGDASEDETESLWGTDDSSITLADDRDFEGPGSSSARPASSNIPQRRPKPASLIITSSFDWEEETTGVGLPAAPQTAPATKHTRPLPPLPASQRPIRPLPRPPQPPPYTSPVYSTPPSASSIPPTQSTFPTPRIPATPSLPSINTTSFISTASSTSSLDAYSTQSSTSKRPLLTPLLTVSACSSGNPSPLTPDIPFPPSPMTAKRHQASKLSKMLGEAIPPELVYGRPRPLPNHIAVTNPKPVNNNLNLAAKDPYTPPAPISRDAQMLAARLRARSDRPQPIYIQDDASEEFGDTDDGEEDEESTSECAEGGSNVSYTGIKVNIPVGENLEDQTYLSPASSRKACSVLASPTDSSLEDYELDDMEEAHIGWALQNVITYEVASRVKRTSRMWVLERNGEKWEEEDYNNVRKALRQL